MNERDLFIAALQKDDDAERSAYLAEACAGVAGLRERIEYLLDFHAQAGSFLNPPAAGAVTATLAPSHKVNDAGPGETADHETPTDLTGSVIAGKYKLLQEIGAGGMGVVYMAEQERPVRRRVALKIIKPGMDSAQVVARFEAERQALAMMDHHNIARALDAGTTDSGRPFFVMELVHGVPITKFCDDNHLSPRERLELFIPVCQAIQHAHQKGVIHRDIKPSNVMVCLYDGKPVPKVIDFGVAKATEQRLTERTLFTQYGTIVGTFEYMSPEQSEMSQLGVDTRSDIYSLGVLLYELLTGTTPLIRARLRVAALDEVLRLIREEEPPKPSTRVTQSKESLASLAALRKTEPAKLSRLMRGELDWIVMKALEKDRARRYETANGLARDVQRYLADEAVEACPPTARYRLRKFARKHRAALATATTFAALLLIGGVASAWQAVRATQAEAAALAARDAEAVSAAEARAVLRFFQDKVLAAARPDGQEGGLGREATIRAAVDAAEPGIATAFADQPAVEGAIRYTAGVTYTYLGEPALAIRQHERARVLRRQALGPDDPNTLLSMNGLAEAYLAAGRLPEAIALHEETLARQKAQLGLDHPDTLMSMNNLAEAYRAAGRLPEAIALHEETLARQKAKLGLDHPDTVDSMNNLALDYHDAGRLPEAIALQSDVLTRQRAKRGFNHPLTLGSMNNLAMMYQTSGRPSEAIALHEEVLTRTKQWLGLNHPNTLASMQNLAQAYQDAGRLAEAIPLFEEELKLYLAKFGPDHPGTLLARYFLAFAYGIDKRFAEALVMFEENLRLSKAKLGPDHPATLLDMRGFAIVYHNQGNYVRAEALLLEAIALGKAKFGGDDPEVSNALLWLGLTDLKQKKFVEAEPILRECLTSFQKVSPDLWSYFFAQSLLGGSLLGQAKYAEAEPLLQSGYAGLKQREGTLPARHKIRLPEALDRLVAFYEATGKPDEAAKWRKELETANKNSGSPTPQ